MAGSSLPTGNVTFLFSDIEGSTRLLQAVGRETYGEVLEEHHGLMRGIAGTAVVSTEGDSFFCVFPTPGEAVNAAVAVQKALHRHAWPKDVEVRVRIGIHTGEGVLGGDDYVGLDVHRTARISSAAHGGQVVISEATRAQVADKLDDAVALRDLGEHRLKDLARPEHLYQLSVAGLPDEFPAPRSLEAPTNLPEHLTSFVGRNEELEEVSLALTESRLVTLTGAGGAGKTRLSIQAGRRAAARYPGGVFFASLSDIGDPDLIGTHIAARLSIPEQVGRPIESTLAEYLAPRRALLIIDNCEHLAEAAAALAADLLRRCPDLTLLATSREALLIPGERLYEVGPMQIVEADGTRDAVESDAVRLFVDRAAAISPGLDIAPFVDECVEICRRLDGIPLAIELAAARAGMLTPAEILARLDDRFGLLTSRSRSTVPRQRTLESAIDWSYDLLDDDERRLLRSLAVFRGGFTLEAVASVCFGGDTSEAAVLDRLTELHEKSLLTQETAFTGTRFGLLETIREYAGIRLRREGEYDEASRRHRLYYTELARREAHRLGREDQLDALSQLEADHDNFRAVMRRALDEDDFESAADIAGRLVWFWYLHAHFTEGERWAGRLLDALPAEPSRPWLRLLLGAAQYDFRIGNYDRAEERLRLVLRLGEEQSAPRVQMWGHAYLATNALYAADLDVAAREAESARRLAQDAGDFIAMAYAQFLLVSEAAYRDLITGDLDAAHAGSLLERLAPVAAGARAGGERNIIGHVIQLEASLHDAAGTSTAAAASFDEAMTAFAELGTVGCACHCIEAIGDFVASSGDPGSAARLIGAAGQLRDDIGITTAGFEQHLRRRALEVCSAALDPDGLAAALEAGAALSLAESAQLARQSLARI